LGNTFYYIIIGVTLSTVLGIYFAVILQRRFTGRSILIAVLILPWALPGVVEGILWTGIWDANTGVLNSILKSLHLITHYQVFLGQNKLITILAIEVVQVWQITPLSTILVLAVLQNIPDDLYEAATIDGSDGRKAFRHITLPLIRPGIAIAVVQAIIATLNIFDQPYILNGAASTGNSLAMETYAVSFQNLNFGQGYALSLLITLFTLFVSVVVAKFIYKKVEY
jgi:multiple sugar transport system permease protein